MSKKTVIISGGPQQLITLIALACQLRRTHEVTGVLSYVVGNERILDFEKFVCKLFGFTYLGSIDQFREKVVEIGFRNIRTAVETFINRDLAKKIQTWLKEMGIWTALKGATIAMPYRRNLVSDNLLLNAIAPEEVLFIPDGVFLTMSNNLIKRIASKALGIKNFLRISRCHFYVPDNLSGLGYASFECSSLSSESLEKMYALIRPEIKLCAKRVCVEILSKPITLLLWQNLYPKFFSDKKHLLEFYREIISAELVDTHVHLLVKPHPRSSSMEINELKNELSRDQKKRVSILEDDLLVACPAEIFYGIFNIQKVVGIASTGIVSMSKQLDMKVKVYSSPKFPKRLQSEIKRVSYLISH